MWRRTNETRPPSSSPEPPTAHAAVPMERAAPPESPRATMEARTLKTLLGRGLVVKGELSGKEDVAIEGVFQGTMRVAGANVIIGPNGRASVEAEADEIILEGHFEGTLRARERVVLRRSSSVHANIETKRLVIEEGALYRGRVEMTSGALGATRSTEDSTNRTERTALPRMAMAAGETTS